MNLTDQDGRTRTLASLRGQPVLVAMFYTSCDHVCPMIAWQLHRLEQALPEAERARLRVLLVSFDPARDTPEALRRFADARHADPARWVVARADESEVRELAAVLGIRYRELEGGAFNHSSVITLLDADGMIRARTSDLKDIDAEFLTAMEATLQ
jgi:protein SCO1/2